MLNRLLLAAAVIPAIILSANAQQVIEPAPNGVVTLDASRWSAPTKVVHYLS